MSLNIGYSSTQGYAHGWPKSELHIRNKIYNKIITVTGDQPTESAAVHGTQAEPLDQTEGVMELGAGTIVFSADEERVRLFADLGDGFRLPLFPILWILRAQGKTDIRYEYFDCRILSNPVDHNRGPEALGGEVAFSFKRHTVNGLSPHGKSGGGSGVSGGLNAGSVGGGIGL